MTFRDYLVPLILSGTLAACGGGQSSTPDRTAVAEAGATPAVTSTLTASNSTPNASASAAAGVTAAAGERGMWSWDDNDVSTTEKQSALLNFAQAHKVTVVYLNSKHLLAEPDLLSAFIDLAAKNKIAVELLFGDSNWALAANQAQAMSMLKTAVTFINGLKGARPVAIHFDVEPQTMAAWPTDSVSLGNQLVDLYQQVKPAMPQGVYLNVDIAMGYENVSLTRGGVTKTMTQWLVDATDRTTLMAYRDYALGNDGIVSHGHASVDYATTKGKRSVIGVETTCGLIPATISFCNEGNAVIESQLALVNQAFSSSGGYGGVAVHDYQQYVALKS